MGRYVFVTVAGIVLCIVIMSCVLGFHISIKHTPFILDTKITTANVIGSILILAAVAALSVYTSSSNNRKGISPGAQTVPGMKLLSDDKVKLLKSSDFKGHSMYADIKPQCIGKACWAISKYECKSTMNPYINWSLVVTPIMMIIPFLFDIYIPTDFDVGMRGTVISSDFSKISDLCFEFVVFLTGAMLYVPLKKDLLERIIRDINRDSELFEFFKSRDMLNIWIKD